MDEDLIPLASSHPKLTVAIVILLIVLCPILEFIKNRREQKRLESSK